MEVVGAAGCDHPAELTPRHVMHRVTEDIAYTAERAYQLVQHEQLLRAPQETQLADEWRLAQAHSFAPAGQS